MRNDFIAGGIGATLGVIGTATQTNETLQTVSLIVTILGAVISFIVAPLVNWIIKAKQDGKVTKEELDEGLEIVAKGAEEVKKATEEAKKGRGENG